MTSRAGTEAAARASTETATSGPGAPAPAEEPIRMEGRPLEQVADAVVEQFDGEGGEARIILDPPELGEIVIKLHARGDQVSLEVVAQRPEAIQMLRDGSPSLQLLLQERGLDLSDAQFSLNHQGQQDSGEQGEQGQSNTSTGFAGLLGFDEPADAANRNHNKLRAAYNPDGAFAYRV
jgi:flagellar hook-length control protein FliK